MVKETYEVSMCVDCAIWHANSELPDSANEERCKQITEIDLPARATVAVVGDDTHFSWAPCDLCDCGLGGDRVDGVVLLWD